MKNNFFARLVATAGGIGYVPFAPGTCASVATWAVCQWTGLVGLLSAGLPLFLISLGVAWWAISKAVPNRLHDPSWVVADEVLGMLLACLLVPADVSLQTMALVLFRFFDIAKPFPIGWAQDRLTGPEGIIADDLLAGCCAALLIRLLFLV